MNTDALLVTAGLRPFDADGNAVADSLDLEAAAGRTLCLVGPTGAGKTTWMRTLAGVDPPASGSLRILGTDVARLDTPAWRRLRCRVAYIAAGAPLLSDVDVINNVMLPALYHRLGSPDAVRAQALATLEFLDYTGPTDVSPDDLSQRQRLLLAIARCLMLAPQLLFMDEPFYMTDAASRRREAEIYRRLAQERGVLVFVATHNLDFVKRYANEIVFIHANGVWKFASWQAFMASPLPQVRGFLAAAAREAGTHD